MSILTDAGCRTHMDSGTVPLSCLCWLQIWQLPAVAAVWRQAAAHPICVPGMSTLPREKQKPVL